MVRLFIFLSITSLMISSLAFASVDKEETEVTASAAPAESLEQSSEALEDLLVNRQPAILHPPIYEDELPVALGDQINMSPAEEPDASYR